MRYLWKHHPNLWGELLELEKMSRCTIGKGKTLAEREREFIEKDKQPNLFDYAEAADND